MRRHKSFCSWLVLACTAWQTATAAPAQAPPAQPNAPSTPVSPLTVEATPRKVLEKQARDFVDAYGAPTGKLGLLARWNEAPACLAVTGLAAEQAAQFKTRIEAVAKAVKAPLAPPKCAPNIEIVFTTEPQKFLDAAVARNPTILGEQGAKTVTRPIQAWYATGTDGVRGEPAAPVASSPLNDAPPPATGKGMIANVQLDRAYMTKGVAPPRRCVDPVVIHHEPKVKIVGGTPVVIEDIPCLHYTFRNVLIVVDAAHMGDVSVDLASDYMALVALSQPKPQSLDGCLALPSVLDLYAKDCAGRDAPAGLTSADNAYLAGLYAADLTEVEFKTQSEQSDIAGRMVKILDSGKPPAH